MSGFQNRDSESVCKDLANFCQFAVSIKVIFWRKNMMLLQLLWYLTFSNIENVDCDVGLNIRIITVSKLTHMPISDFQFKLRNWLVVTGSPGSMFAVRIDSNLRQCMRIYEICSKGDHFEKYKQNWLTLCLVLCLLLFVCFWGHFEVF